MIMWRSKVITASNRIFPGLIYHDWEKQYWDAGIYLLFKINVLLFFELRDFGCRTPG